MFDPDAFVEQIQARKNNQDISALSQPLKYPQYKVPNNGLQKLNDKKIVSIILDIKI